MKTNRPKLSSLIAQRREIARQMREFGGELVKDALKELFEANPSFTAVGWSQWAPYFNDGEPCEFSVHEFFATKLPLGELDSFDPYHGWSDSYDQYEDDKAVNKAARDFARAAEASINDEDLLRSAFEDDCAVIAYYENGEVKYSISHPSHD